MPDPINAHQGGMWEAWIVAGRVNTPAPKQTQQDRGMTNDGIVSAWSSLD
jgi:hypothetical protein